MSTTVDQRVVSMQFDNAQFEKGVQQTLTSLNKLNTSIEQNTKVNSGRSLDGLAKSLDTIKYRAAQVAATANDLSDKFSVVGTIGRRAIENVTDSMYGLAKQAAGVITGITQISDGFSKYQQKVGAVSTLMTATGASMEEVTKAMTELQWFTDETSYNFADMIDTMSKMSASGEKDLTKLLRFTEGFALAAAKAGVGAEKTSHAMYQLTQAASRGYIQYQDWQQALGTTNIATDDLKRRMIEAGGAQAIAAGANKDFNSSLRKGWLTIDTFGKVMNDFTQGINEANYANGKFTDSLSGGKNSTTKFSEEAFRCAQECRSWADAVNAVNDAVGSGWSDSFELILGNVEEVKALFTGIANVAISISEEFSEARNAILETWNELGGRTDLLQIIVNLINGIHYAIEPIKEAFEETFGGMTGENLKTITGNLSDMSSKLLLTQEQMNHIRDIFLEVFGTIKTVMDIVKRYRSQISYVVRRYIVISSILKSIQKIIYGGLGLTKLFAIIKLLIGLEIASRLFNTQGLLQKIIGIVGVLGSKISGIVSLVKRIDFNGIFSGIINTIKNFDFNSVLTSAENVIWKLKDHIIKLISRINVSRITSKIVPVLNGIKTIIERAFKNIDFSGIINAARNKFIVFENIVSNVIQRLNLTSAFRKVGVVISNVLNTFYGGLNKILGLEFGKKANNSIQKMAYVSADSIKKVQKTGFLSKVIKLLQTVGKAISVTVNAVLQNSGMLLNRLKEFNVVNTLKMGFQDFFNVVKGLFSFLGGAISSLGAFKNGAINTVLETSSYLIQHIISGIKNLINFVGRIFNFENPLTSLIEAVKSGQQYVDQTGDNIAKLSTPLKDAGERTATLASNMKDAGGAVGVLGSALSGVVAYVNGVSNAISDGISNAVNDQGPLGKFIRFFTSINWQKILSIGLIFAYIKNMIVLNKTISNFSTGLNNIVTAFTSIGSTIKKAINYISSGFNTMTSAIANYYNSLTRINNYKMFKQVAIGIAAIAGALVLLSFVPVDRLVQTGAVLIVISAAILFFASRMSKVSKDVNPVGLAALAGGFLVFALTLLEVASILAIATAVVNHVFDSSKSLGEAVARLIAPLAIVMSLCLTVATSLGILIMSFAAIGSSAKIIGAGALALAKAGGGMVAFAAGLIAIELALNAAVPLMKLFVGQMNNVFTAVQHLIGEQIVIHGKAAGWINIIGTISAVIFTIMGLVKAAEVISNMLSKMTLEMAGSILVFTISLVSLAKALNILSKNSGEYGKIFILLSESMIVMIGAFSALQRLNIDKAADGISKITTGMVKIAIAAVILNLAVKAFGKMDPKVMLQGLAGISTGIFAMSLAVKALDAVNVGKVAAAMLGLVVSMYLLTPLIALYGIAWPVLAKGMMVVAGGMLALATACKLMEKADFAKTLFNMGVMIAAVYALKEILMELQGIPVEQLTGTAVALSGTILALAIAIDMINVITQSLDAGDLGTFIASVAAMSGAVVVLSYCMTMLAAIPGDQVMVIAGAMAVAMMSFSAAAMLLAAATQILKSANVPAMAIMMIVFAASLSVLSLALSTLSEVPTMTIIATIASFTIAIAALVAVFALAGPYIDAAIPAIAALSVVLLSVSAVMISFGLGAVLFSQAIQNIVSAISQLLGVAQSFIIFIAGMSTQALGITEMAGALTLLGLALIPLSLGMSAVSVAGMLFAAALISVGTAATVFGAGLLIASAGAMEFREVVITVANDVQNIASQAIQWGSDMINGFASGIRSGIDAVAGAASAAANAIAGFLHHSTPPYGALAGDDQWGLELMGVNIGGGMLKGLPIVGQVASSGASLIKNNFLSGVQGTGTTANGNILSELWSGIDNFSSAGAAAGNAYASSMSGVINGFLAKLQGGVRKITIKKTGNEAPIKGIWEDSNGNTLAMEQQKQDVNRDSIISLEDLIPKNIENNNKSLPSNDKSLPSGGGGGLGSGKKGKGGGSGSKSDSDAKKAAEEAAKRQKTINEYTEKATRVTNAYNKSYGYLLNQFGDGTPIENSKKAISDLAETLYKAGLTSTETADSTVDHERAVAEAFNKAYTTIYDKINGSIDLFTKFDNKIKDTADTKTIMQNARSQIAGVTEMAVDYGELAKKGFNPEIVAKYCDGSVENLGHVHEMLMMNTKQVEIMNQAWNMKKQVSNYGASMAMAAQATAIQTQKLRETVKTQHEVEDQAKSLWKTYQDQMDSGLLDDASKTLDNIYKLAEANNTTFDELKGRIDGTKQTAEEATLKMMDLQSQSLATLKEYEKEYENMYDKMGKALDSLYTSFDKLELKTDTSSSDMLENLETTNDSIEQWYEELMDLSERGLDQKVLSQLATSGPQGYEQLHAFAEMSDEELDEANDLLKSRAEMLQMAQQEFADVFAKNSVGGLDAFNDALNQYTEGSDFEAAKTQAEAIGSGVADALKKGISDGTVNLVDQAKQTGAEANSATGENLNEENGYQHTANFMKGMLRGIEDYKQELLDEIDEITELSSDEVYDGWEEGSPSRLTRKYAGWFIEGMVRGFKDNTQHLLATVSTTADSVSGVVNNALQTASNLLIGDMNVNPTITPVLNLADAQNGIRELNGNLGRNHLDLNLVPNTQMGPIMTNMESQNLRNVDLANLDRTPKNNNFNFTQNNYSPKALSRVEIYRQTRSQIAQVKGMVNANA